MKIGYARASTRNRLPYSQIDALKTEGCENIFIEKQSALSIKSRPELNAAIRSLSTNDIIVFAEWWLATRSFDDGIEIIRRIYSQGAMLKVLDRSYLDLTTPLGRELAMLLSSIAEDERNRIIGRAQDGRERAKKRGVRFGRPERFPPATLERLDIERRLKLGESCNSISDIYNCDHKTIGSIRDKMGRSIRKFRT